MPVPQEPVRRRPRARLKGDPDHVPGVIRHKGKWRARVHLKGRWVYLGLYPTREAAEAEVRAARAALGLKNVRKSERPSFGGMLRIFMRVQRVTRKVLLARTGISPATLSEILSGVSGGSWDNRVRLAQALDIDLRLLV